MHLHDVTIHALTHRSRKGIATTTLKRPLKSTHLSTLAKPTGITPQVRLKRTYCT
jgi:hypothetical protein